MASKVAGSSRAAAAVAAPSTAGPYPDDSDFLDSDAEGETYDIVEVESESLVRASSPAGTEFNDSSSPAPQIPLIYISNRLYFTYFDDPAPSPSSLNQGDGAASAWFEAPKQRPGAAAIEQDIPSSFYWFNIDEDLVYLSFFEDWGPLNVALFYRFCMHVHQLLNDESLSGKALVFFSSSHPHRKANASLLAAMYSMIIDHITPADAFHPFSEIEFKPFRDAGYGRADYCLNMQDVLYGVHRAIDQKLLDLSEFNLDEYEYYEQVQCGDWNWITPNFLAFASPNDREYVASLKSNGGSGALGSHRLPQVFTNTVRYFKERNIQLVVRLNNPLYDKAVFEDAGIAHLDLYFDDGSNPSEEILKEFIRRAEAVVQAGGAIAVHCKAGLGRTGVLIGAYLVWKYGFSASEAIGFMRIMRPGCVVGPQQHFMYQHFIDWVRWSVRDQALAMAKKVIEAERAAMGLSSSAKIRRPLKRLSTSSEEEDVDDDVTEEIEVESAIAAPVTPRVVQAPRVVPATAAPSVKPVPCVGQPRKSPSPSRKRPATAAAHPRQRAPEARTLGALKTSNSITNNELARSTSEESLHATDSKTSLTPATSQGNGIASMRDSWEALSTKAIEIPSSPPSKSPSMESTSAAPSTPRAGRVLAEAQRINGSTPQLGSTTPTSGRKAGMPSSSSSHENLDTTRAPQSLSAAPEAAPSKSVEDIGTPSRAVRIPSYKASAQVRAAYGLRDSKSPHPRSPRTEAPPSPQPSSGSAIQSSHNYGRSDAGVLGVLGVNSPQAASSRSTAGKVAPSPAPAAPTQRTYGRVPSTSNSISPAKIRGGSQMVSSTRSTNTTGTSTSSAPQRNSVRVGSNGSSATRAAGPSAKLMAAAASNGTRSTASTSSPSRPIARPGAAGSSPATRVPSNGTRSNGAPSSTLSSRSPSRAAPMSTTTPISNGANAAMLAARANLKRARPSPEVPQNGFEQRRHGDTSSKPPVSGSAAANGSRFGRNVRRRRSSLGEADIGMA
ncbi:unnamed protein product [Jaminaea pallidilutea]